MKPSNLLHDIIKTLTPEERSDFLQHASLQQGDKNYKKLFLYLETVDEYNEEKVKKHFKDETFAKHLASEKNQLLHHLLKSLRNQRISDKKSAASYEKVKDVQLLYAKGLAKLAKAEADKIRELVINDELCFSFLDLIEIELDYFTIGTNCDKAQTQKVKQLLEEKDHCLDLIAVKNKYKQLVGELEYYFNQNVLVHDRSKKPLLESFLSHPYIADLSHANSKKALLLGTYARMICYRLVGDNGNLGVEIGNALKLFKEHEFLIEEFPKIYISLCGFHARYLAVNANLKKAKEAIDHLRDVKGQNYFATQDLQNTIFTRLTVYDLMFYNYSGQFEKSEAMLDEVEANLEKHKLQYPGHERTTIYFLMFVTNFAKGNYNRALKCINEILNMEFEEARQDLYRLAKICNLIVHYELNNTDYLVYSYKSTLRFFSQIDYPFEYELSFLKHFKTIAISKKYNDKRKLFLDFKENLTVIFKDPYQIIASEYFDLIAWTDVKINGSSYIEEIRKLRSIDQQ